MSDGALSWLAMVAGSYFADGNVPRRGDLPLAGSLVCYRPYECSDGWVSLGALEPKFWQAFCRGVEREDLIPRQFEGPGQRGPPRRAGDLRRAHPRRLGAVRARTRLLPGAGPGARRGARPPSSCASARWSSRSSSPGARQPVRQLGVPIKLGRTPGDHARLPGPAARRAHRGGAARRPATPRPRSRSCCAAARPPGRPRSAATRRCAREDQPASSAGGDRRAAPRAAGAARAPAGGRARRAPAAAHERARGAHRGQPRDDPLLPARGPARAAARTSCARAATWPTTPTPTWSGSR